MKKLLLSLFSLALFFPLTAFAQTGGSPVSQCSPITSANYPLCCPSAIPTTARMCANFLADTCAQNPSDPVCNAAPLPPRGGTQQTGSVSDSTITGDELDSSVPQSGSSELSACSAIRFKSLFDILVWIKCIILATIIPLIFILAFLFFLWGVFKFMRATDMKTKQESQKLIWWGIIGLFVMVSVWGIIKILGTTLGIDSDVVPMLQTEYLKVPKR